VITEHSTVYQRRPIPRFQLEEARAALSAADARLVVSPQLGELMERVVGPEACPWEWVPNMVDPAFLEADLSAVRAPGPFRFLNVAFMQEKKGQAALLEAYAKEFGDDPGIQLRVGGDGPERGRLHETARSLGIEERVVWLGPLDREAVRDEMLAADAFVLSSQVETFGVVLVEALACGLPVVATRSGGPECIVAEGDGLLVSVGDASALGGAMARIHRDIALFDRGAIRRGCAERFSEAALVGRLDAVYARAGTG
jgi:glycosyltransferase involved in cell wall biosynthesis